MKIEPFSPIFRDAEKKLINSILEFPEKGNEIISLFENELASFLDVSTIVTVANATVAFFLILKKIGIEKSDEVIIPDYTFVSAANMVELAGGTPIFCDIKEGGFTLSVDALLKEITPKTKAVLYISSLGFADDISEIEMICKERNIVFIHDAASSFGTLYDGKSMAKYGDYTFFSFHYKKVLSSFEGGAVYAKNKEENDWFSNMRNHGIPSKFNMPGYNFRISPLNAAIGYEKLKRIDDITKKRVELEKYYEKKLKTFENIFIPKKDEKCRSVFQEFPIFSIQKEEIKKYFEHYGVGMIEPASVLHKLPYYSKKYLLSDDKFPNTVRAVKEAIAFPLYEKLEKSDIDYIVSLLEEFK